MDEKTVNEVLELVRIHEHYSEKSRSLLNYILVKYTKGDLEDLVKIDDKCREITSDVYKEITTKIDGTGTFFSLFKLLNKSIENKNKEREDKIRRIIKNKLAERND